VTDTLDYQAPREPYVPSWRRIVRKIVRIALAVVTSVVVLIAVIVAGSKLYEASPPTSIEKVLTDELSVTVPKSLHTLHRERHTEGAGNAAYYEFTVASEDIGPLVQAIQVAARNKGWKITESELWMSSSRGEAEWWNPGKMGDAVLLRTTDSRDASHSLEFFYSPSLGKVFVFWQW
jgi:hypothetical protein